MQSSLSLVYNVSLPLPVLWLIKLTVLTVENNGFGAHVWNINQDAIPRLFFWCTCSKVLYTLNAFILTRADSLHL
jgi:hypothetical protein